MSTEQNGHMWKGLPRSSPRKPLERAASQMMPGSPFRDAWADEFRTGGSSQGGKQEHVDVQGTK